MTCTESTNPCICSYNCVPRSQGKKLPIHRILQLNQFTIKVVKHVRLNEMHFDYRKYVKTKKK